MKNSWLDIVCSFFAAGDYLGQKIVRMCDLLFVSFLPKIL